MVSTMKWESNRMNRQVKVLNAILQNWDDVDKAIQQSTNSTGSATKENEVYKNSIAGLKKELESAWQNLSQTVIDGDWIKAPIKALTEIVGVLTSLAKNDVIMTVLGIFLGTKAVKGIGGLGNFAKDFFSSLGSIFSGSKNATKGIGSLLGKIKDIPAAFKIAKQEGAGFKGVLDLLGISASTTQIAIGALTAAVTIGLAIWQGYRQAEQEARQTALNNAQTASEQSDNIAELSTKYLKLSEAVNLDSDSKSELLSVQKELLSNFALEGETVESLTEKYGSLSEAVKAKSIESLKASQIDLIAGVTAAKKNLIDTGSDGILGGNNIISAQGDSAVAGFKALEKAGLITNSSYGTGGGAFVLTGDDTSVDGVLDNYNKIGKALDILRSSFSGTELENNQLFQNLYNRYQELTPQVEEYTSSIQKLNKNVAQQQIIQSLQGREIPKTQAAFDAWNKSVLKSAEDNGSFIGSVDDIKTAVNSAFADMPEFSDFMPKLETEVTVTTTVPTLEESSKEITALNNALKEQQTGIGISAESYDALITANKDYAKCLDNVNGTMQINVEKAKEIAKQNSQMRIDDLIAQSRKEGQTFAKNADQIAKLREQYNRLGGEQGSAKSTILASINTLLDEQETVSGNIDKYTILISKLQELTSEYTNWNNAKSTANRGDKLTTLEDARKDILSGLDSGRTGTDDYQSAVDLLIPDSVGEQGKDRIRSYQEDVLKRYMTFDDSGAKTSEGAQNFLSDAIAQGLMIQDGSNITVAAGQTMQTIANAMTLTPDMVQAMFGELQEFEFNFDWTDEYQQKLEADKQKTAELKTASEQNKPVVSIDDTGFTTTYTSIIDRLNNLPVSKTVDIYENTYRTITTNGNVGISGNHDLQGTANAGGTWGAKTGGKTLVGELGREIIVNQFTGKWHTVGENGAEFVDIPKGAIVFNHLQTEQILKNGFVNSRGLSMAGGSALVSGGGSWDNFSTKYPSNPFYDGSSSYNTSTPSADAAEDSKEQLDWIERLLKKVKRTINNIGAAAENAFKKLTTRTKALSKEYSSVTDQIEINTLAAKAYLSEANSLGLSSKYTKKIKNGTMDIETISNEDLRNKISQYQDLYDKATDLQDKNEELKQTLSEIAETNFNNISTQYENLITISENKASILDSRISLAEAQGKAASAKFYSEQYGLKKSDLSSLEKKRKELSTQLSNMVMAKEVEIGSEKYNEMYAAIQDVDKAIVSTQVDMAELNNSIRQIAWDRFDLLQEKISDVADESDFLISLIGDDNLFNKDTGKATDNYDAVMGMHFSKYNTYQEQANKYAQEIKAINSSLAKDPNNQLLIDRKKELVNAQQDSVLAAKDELKAALDLKKQGYEAELSALQKIIDKKKESLSAESDLFSYQKNVSDQTKKIAELQKQYDTYADDNSEEGKKKRQELSSSLKEAQDNFEETKYNRFISDQEKILDNLSTEFENNFNDKINNQDELTRQLIEESNNNSSSISETIKGVAADIGYSLSDNIKSIWSSDNPVSSFVNGSWSNYASGTLSVLNNIAAKIKAEQSDADTNASKNISEDKTNNSNIGKTPTKDSSSSGSGSSSNSSSSTTKKDDSKSLKYVKNWYYKKDTYPKNLLDKEHSIDDRLKYYNFNNSNANIAKYYSALGGSGSYKGTASQNTWLIKQMKAQGYSSGGKIGKLINATGEDGFILAKTGEEVLSIPKLELLEGIVSDLLRIPTIVPQIPTVSMSNGIGNHNVDIHVDELVVPDVKDAKEFADNFVDALKESSKARNAIVTLTTDTIMGKNNLNYRKL